MDELYDLWRPGSTHGPCMVRVPLDSVVRVINVHPADLVWAIEECGRCDTDVWTVRPTGHLILSNGAYDA